MNDSTDLGDQALEAIFEEARETLAAHDALRWPGLGVLERQPRARPEGVGQFHTLGLRPSMFWVQALRLRARQEIQADTGWIGRLAARWGVSRDRAAERLDHMGRGLVGRILAQGGASTPVGNFVLVRGERTLPSGMRQRLSFVDFWPRPELLVAIQEDGAAAESAMLFYQLKAQQMQMVAADEPAH